MLSATPLIAKSYRQIANKTHRREADENNQQAWASEYRGKINEYHGTIDSFINVLVPASEAVCPPMDCSRQFDEVLEDCHEPLMYNPLVNGFLALTKDFPMAKSLRFHDNSTHLIPFPYMSWDLHHHRTKPDLITSYPGTTTSLKDPRWQDVVLAIEVKPKRDDDPIGAWPKDRDNTMRQLVKNGRNLLVGHSGLFAFVFGIFGHEARIFRFDHSSCIVSPRFNYVERPELFRQFFWNFVNPHCGTRISGDDPTVDTRTTRSHLRWVKDVLEPEDVQGSDTGMHRWISADAVTKEGVTVKMNLLTVKLLFINPCLFSRSTTVWSAIDKDDINGKQYVIKDSWRQGLRESEMTYYSHIMKTLRDRNEEPFGLAVLKAGADLGDLEDKERMKLDDQIREPLVPGNAPSDLPDPSSTPFIHLDGEGNVYMIDDMSYKGFIGDFDYSSFLPGVRDGHDDPTRPDADPNDSLKERTGTYAFMAVELLEERRVIHDAHHDLESFYWLLIWLVLRHTSHDDPKGAKRCSLLFFHDDDVLCGEVKRAWLGKRKHVAVPGNAPLTWLVDQLTKLCNISQATSVPLTYEAVLEKFETVLKMDGWPEADCAIPFKPYVETEKVGHADPANAAIAAANQTGASTKARSRKASIDIQATALNKSSKRKYEPEPQVVQHGGAELRRSKRARSERVMSLRLPQNWREQDDQIREPRNLSSTLLGTLRGLIRKRALRHRVGHKQYQTLMAPDEQNHLFTVNQLYLHLLPLSLTAPGCAPNPVAIYFRRTKRMVEALCDAIKGHQQAYSTGMLHGGVSEGNVYMIDGKPYKGFISDFDCSSFMPGVLGAYDVSTRPDADENNGLKERTGTFAFMAIEPIKKRVVIHGAHHDLESFYWLLIWLVLRHTAHDSPKGARQCSLLFFHDDDWVCASQKAGWLGDPTCLGVPGNAPLTWLLGELTKLCYRGQSTLERPAVLLTYDAVLEKFETALSMDGWPEDDHAIPFKRYVETEEVGHADPANAAIAAAIAAANQAGESTKARSRKASIKIQATALNKSSKRKYEPEPQEVEQGVEQGGAELRRSKRARSKRVMSRSARAQGHS
ncbi:predicted protein [Sparassis crispa]|uniref:Fungal-type protein kinase domain-containing protein n=1 Tax=Sparassis crispa TaxID=139825 RepID=A0A401GN06_9APHY|nr:predicted protein [Sparassis crispa]GBE83593.1 predicted protein [Sparassis crispa]